MKCLVRNIASVCLGLCLLLLHGLAAAQGTTSRVAGVVRDTSGAVMPGVTVTLVNEDTGASFTAATTAAGGYVFEAVQVGRYTVSFELQGFKTYVSNANRVIIGQPATVNATLELGAIDERVTVTSPIDRVQVSSSGNVGTNFEQKVIESLPIVGGRGRNPLDLVLTQPGVVSGSNTGGGVHVHGARDRAWNFTLDGIDVNETSAGGGNFSPLRTNPDALAEFQVLTSNMTAEFGRNSGGHVAMITRSGTNNLEGTLFYFDRRPEYNANEWENNLDNLPKREFYQKIPGFSVGGPIRRNRTFFFVNTQWLRADLTRQVTRTVLTQTARQGLWRYVMNGRNSAAGTPNSSVDASGNVLPGLAVDTYDIAASDPQRRGLDAAIRNLLLSTPLPNNFTTGDGLNTAGFTWLAPEAEKQYDVVAKIDHVVNPRHSVFGRMSKGQQNTVCDGGNGGLPTFPGGGCIVNTERSPYNWVGNWRWNPGSSWVNELVAGQNHFKFDFVLPTADASRLTLALPLGLANPETSEFGNLRSIDTYQLVDNLSFLAGAHSFKIGTNIRLQRHRDTRGSVAGFNVSPVVNFSTTINSVDPTIFALPATIDTVTDRGNLQSAINLMLGRVGQISQGFVQQGSSYGPGGTLFDFVAHFDEYDFYAQDTWKPRSNITVDLGLRWELRMAPTNPDGLIRRPNQRVAVSEPGSNTLRWELDDLYDDDVDNFSPSAGIAWDPRGDGRSVIRGNYRLAYDRINTFLLSSSIFQSIPGISTGVSNTALGTAGARLRDGLPGLQPTVTPESFLQPSAVGTGNIRVMDPEFTSPYTHGWLLSYQRELWNGGTVDVAYIGRRAERLFGAYNVNQVDIRNNGFLNAFNAVKAGGESPLINQLLANDTRRLATETGSQFMRRQFPTELNQDSVAGLASALGARVQSGRTLSELAGLGPYFFFPYPQFLGGVFVIDSNDWSRYHALEVKVNRRLANGYSYLLGYTWSQSKDTRSFDPAFTVVSTGNAQSASSTPFDIFDRSLNYSLSDFDRTHVLQAQGVFQLPFGRDRRWGRNAGGLADALIGGWQIATQMVIQTGRPFTIYSGSTTLSNVVQTPANCRDCSGTEGAVYRETDSLVWYLTTEERARFSTPGAGAFSNVGRNAFRGPGSFNLNASIAKRIDTVKGHYLEIRADATNVTNTPAFGFPTATITSTLFGRIRNSVVSTARQVMVGVKYYF